MSKSMKLVLLLLLCGMGSAHGDDLTLDAAIGGAVGGAIGGAVGAQLGGRDGAIAGAGLGAAAGAAINTVDHDGGGTHRERYNDDYNHGGKHAHNKRFCPPGQAKKGRC